MRMPDELAAMLREKLSKDLGFWARHYEAAVSRIADHTDDPANPYYASPANESCAYFGPVLLDEYGGEESPEAARDRAFELLVLADLASITPEAAPPAQEERS